MFRYFKISPALFASLVALFALFAGRADATATGSLAALAKRYGCDVYPNDTLRTQCVLGMVRAHCYQTEAATVLEMTRGARTLDVLHQLSKTLDGCFDEATPFNSQGASWAAAEVYLDRAHTLLGAPAAEGPTPRSGRLIPRAAYAHPPGNVEGIRVSCDQSRVRKAALLVKAESLGNASACTASAAPGCSVTKQQHVKSALPYDVVFDQCATIVTNGWGSAVGLPIYMEQRVAMAESLYAYYVAN